MDWRESEKRIFLTRIFDLKRRREFELAEQEIRTALERYPDDPQFQVMLADAHWRQGRRGEAEALMKEVAERAQGLDGFHSLKATIEMTRRKYPAALESFRAAHALKPSPFYLKRQADCLLQLKRYDEAWAILRSLIDQDDPYSLGAAARAMEGMGRNDEAERYYRRILEISPGNDYARTRLLQLSVAAEQPETARREVDRMLRVPSRRNDAALLRVKADQLRDQNRHDEASEVYRQLMKTTQGPDRDFYRRQMAFACYRAGMDQEAYPLFVEMVREKPRDSYLRNTLIALGRRRGQLADVADLFAQLARQDPSHGFLFGIVKRIRREIPSTP